MSTTTEPQLGRSPEAFIQEFRLRAARLRDSAGDASAMLPRLQITRLMAIDAWESLASHMESELRYESDPKSVLRSTLAVATERHAEATRMLATVSDTSEPERTTLHSATEVVRGAYQVAMIHLGAALFGWVPPLHG